MNHPGFAPAPQASPGSPALRFLGAVLVALSIAFGLLPVWGPLLAINLWNGGPGQQPPAYIELLMFIPVFAVLLVPLGLIGTAAGLLCLWFGRKRKA